MAERRLAGLAAAGGIAIGRLRVVRSAHETPGPATHIGLAEAIESTIAQLRQLQAEQDGLARDILEFQIELLDDPVLTEGAFAYIVQGGDEREAFVAAIQTHLDLYDSADAELFIARAADIRDLRDRVLAHMDGGRVRPDSGLAGGILLGAELTPSAFIETDWRKMIGVATSGGSPASHVATLARARGIPLIVGLGADDLEALDGCNAVLDGDSGELLVDPDQATLDHYAERSRTLASENGEAEAKAGRPAVTASGQRVPVYVNVDDIDALDAVPRDWCDGIGLARSEMLLIANGALVDEATEIAIYRRLFDWTGGAPTTIRLLDPGGDKPVNGLTHGDETNPFLGLRGIRLLLRHGDLLRRQIRAILIAAEGRPARILVPMVTLPPELAACRNVLESVREELGAKGEIELGAMVETPAMALTIELFDADFLSIGTNDLIQYVMAAARDNRDLADLQRFDHPAVAELIGRIAKSGRGTGREVSLCGDAAGDIKLLPRILEAGVGSVSVPPALVAVVKAAIRRVGA